MNVPNSKKSGFTIVELLVVIVVIGILAAITIVSYTGIAQKAKIVSMKSDLSNASTQIKMFQVNDPSGNYPTANNCPSPSATEICLKASNGNTFPSVGGYTTNNSANPKTFQLDVVNGATKYRITNDSAPLAVVAPTCPTGFIVVPGSATYGVSDFCVMKYEAKQVGTSNVPVSTYADNPWVSITQTDAIANSPNVAGCTGCHLITESEWLTIAQNVLSVASNWSGGAVGNGYIYSGHSDNDPVSAQPADSSDANGYANTNDSSGDMVMTNGKIGDTQRRTLNLSNGEVIWDLSGNVWEWTSDAIASGQQPGLSGEFAYAWKQWNDGSLLINGLPAKSMPGFTGIAGASSWSSTHGIGALYSNYGEVGVRRFVRGGAWTNGNYAGVLALNLNRDLNGLGTDVGFRVAK